jgi:hypothetical protein
MKVKHERFSEQYDHVFGEYIDKVKTKYAAGIGLFLIRFSSLEHTLDTCILDLLSDREHSSGYILIEGISPNSKIDLFRKLFHAFIRHMHPRRAAKLRALSALVKRLHAARVFRNYLAHANWNTLDNTGYVRTKVDEKDGEVIFKKVRITPKVIKAWIRRVLELERRLDHFAEDIGQIA